MAGKSKVKAKSEINQAELLYRIAKAMAAVKDGHELLKIIVEEVQPIFGFYDIGLAVLDQSTEFFLDWAVYFAEINPSELNQVQRANNIYKFAADDPLMKHALARAARENKPFIENMTAEFIEEFKDFPHLPLEIEYGYKQFLVTTLKFGGKTLGLLNFNGLRENHFDNCDLELFQAIADLVAVAVANILANDEIKERLNEISKLKKRLEAENKYLFEEVSRNYNFEEIIGASPRLIQVFEVIETVAPTDATVLIQGETGTGKELVARAVHNRSTRGARPLIKINCAALPRELVESELFGHERGSFTGAFEKRLGKFELADKGTIFLDEIGELPLEMQVKLLRVLQEREIERLGGKGTIKLDLRVVAATNRNLAQEVQEGRFRADLYFRLCTVELFLPALRERQEDIEPLTLYFAQKYAAKFSRRIECVSTEMLTELNAYDFPGNIRELEHIVEHAVIFSKNEKLMLPRSLAGNGETQISKNAATAKTALPKSEQQTLETVERAHIIEVLRQTSGKIKGAGGAAKILGLNPATLYFRMKKLGIEKNRS